MALGNPISVRQKGWRTQLVSLPTAGDCYRFNLTNSAVDLCLTGPRSVSDLTAALEALDKGPMTLDEMDWMRRVGKAKYFKPRLFSIKG